MRVSVYVGSLLVAAAVVSSAQAQKGPMLPNDSMTTGTVSPRSPGGCLSPNALGVGRVVEIDTTGGPGFGFSHFKQHDFLREGEVVITLDDGPWPGSTPAVLRALAAQCAKATFFSIGKHAMWHPETPPASGREGHTIGTTPGRTPRSSRNRSTTPRRKSKKASARSAGTDRAVAVLPVSDLGAHAGDGHLSGSATLRCSRPTWTF
jgi:hypothetical protein